MGAVWHTPPHEVGPSPQAVLQDHHVASVSGQDCTALASHAAGAAPPVRCTLYLLCGPCLVEVLQPHTKTRRMHVADRSKAMVTGT